MTDKIKKSLCAALAKALRDSAAADVVECVSCVLDEYAASELELAAVTGRKNKTAEDAVVAAAVLGNVALLLAR